MPVLTADWTDDDCAAEIAVCDALGIDDVTVPLQVWANESDNKPGAHNPNGDASGIFQLMPSIAKGLGYNVAADPHLEVFRRAGVTEQLRWATKFYGNHRGQVGTVARFYLCTFLPALLSCGDDMSHAIAAKGGTLSGAYDANPVFDHDHKGWITVGDLVAAAARATGPRTRELMARVVAIKAARADTDPAPGT
jgi:hypothetical protein